MIVVVAKTLGEVERLKLGLGWISWRGTYSTVAVAPQFKSLDLNLDGESGDGRRVNQRNCVSVFLALHLAGMECHYWG